MPRLAQRPADVLEPVGAAPRPVYQNKRRHAADVRPANRPPQDAPARNLPPAAGAGLASACRSGADAVPVRCPMRCRVPLGRNVSSQWLLSRRALHVSSVQQVNLLPQVGKIRVGRTFPTSDQNPSRYRRPAKRSFREITDKSGKAGAGQGRSRLRAARLRTAQHGTAQHRTAPRGHGSAPHRTARARLRTARPPSQDGSRDPDANGPWNLRIAQTPGAAE